MFNDFLLISDADIRCFDSVPETVEAKEKFF